MFLNKYRVGLIAALAALCVVVVVMLVFFHHQEPSSMDIVDMVRAGGAPSQVTIQVSLPACIPAGSPPLAGAGFYTGSGSVVAVPGLCPAGVVPNGLHKIPPADFAGDLCIGFSAANCQKDTGDKYAQALEIIALSQRLTQMEYVSPNGQLQHTKNIIVQLPVNSTLVNSTTIICPDIKLSKDCKTQIVNPIPLCLATATSSCDPATLVKYYAYANVLLAMSQSEVIQ